jgi:hypothetical protein
MSEHAICRALKARGLLDWPLPASRAGRIGGNDDDGTSGGGQSWIAHRICMVLSPPLKRRHDGNEGSGQVKAKASKSVIAMARRVVSDDDSNGNGGKSNGDGNKGGGRVTTRAMAAATTVAWDNEGNGDGNEGGKHQRG